MPHRVCILSAEEAFSAMLEKELLDRGMHVFCARKEGEAALFEADTYLVDADAFSFTPAHGRVVLYGRRLVDAPPPFATLHRPFLLSALPPLMQGEEKTDLFLREGERAVVCHGESIKLTEKEYALLCCLLSAGGTPVSREELLAKVWGEGEHDPGILPVYLHYLRKKLERNGQKMIYAVRGRGYALRQEGER